MTTHNLSIKAILDNSKFRQGIRDMNSDVKRSQDEFRKMNRVLKDNQAGAVLTAKKIDNLNLAYDTNRKKVEATSNIMKELADNGHQESETYKRLADDLQLYQVQLYESGVKAKTAGDSTIEYAKNLQASGDELIALGDKHIETGKKISDFSNKLSLAGAGVGMFFKKSHDAFMEYEGALVGVGKTTDMNERQLKEYGETMKELSESTLPRSAAELLNVSEIGGQLGIEIHSLAGFTETVIRLADSTNLTIDEGATALARFANITRMSQDDFDQLGASIVDVGNNTATSEQEIVQMAMRIAAAGTDANMTQAEIIGLSGALSSLGLPAEMGGSAFSKLTIKMKVASESGKQVDEVIQKTGMSLRDLEMLQSHNGKAFGELAESMGMTKKEMGNVLKAGRELEDFSKVAGVSAQEFSRMFEEDATNALITFIEGLAKVEEEGGNATVVLEEMGIKEVRLRDSIMRLTKGHELLRDSVNLSSEAWEENGALLEESNMKYETQEAILERNRNVIKNNMIDVGEKLVPTFLKLSETMVELVDKWNKMDDSAKDFYITLGKFLVISGPMGKLIGGGVTGLGKMTKGFGSLVKASGKAIETNRKMEIAQEMLNEVFGSGKNAVESLGGASKLAGKNISYFDDETGKVIGTLKHVTDESGKTKTSVVNLGDGMVKTTGGFKEGIKYFIETNKTLLVMAGVLGTVVAGVKLFSDWNKVSNSTILDTNESMNLTQRLMAGLRGETVHTKDELIEMGYVAQDFSETVGGELGDALNKARDKTNEFSDSIANISWDGVVTKKDKESILSQVDDAIATADKAVKEGAKGKEALLKELFMNDGQINKLEQKVLDDVSNVSKVAKEEMEKNRKEINDILEKAFKEDRALTPEEEEAVRQRYERIVQIELEAIAEAEQKKDELDAIYKANALGKDLKATSEFLQQQRDRYRQELAEQKISHEMKLEELDKLIESSEGKDKEHWENVKKTEIQEHENQLERINGHYENVREETGKHNKNLFEDINYWTGEVVERRDKTYYQMLVNMLKDHEELEGISETGWYNVKDSATGEMKELYINVDELTGDIIGVYDDSTGKMMGYTKDLAKETKESGRIAETALNEMATAFQMGSDVSIKALENLGGEIGDTTKVGDDLYETVVKINGKELKVKHNNKGVIQSLGTVMERLRWVIRNRSQTVTVTTNQVTRYKTYGSPPATGGKNRVYSPHFTGLDYVPYNEYRAILHEGERVLTKEENEYYDKASTKNVAQTLDKMNRRIEQINNPVNQEQVNNYQNGTTKVVNVNFEGNYQFAGQDEMDYFIDEVTRRLGGKF